MENAQSMDPQLYKRVIKAQKDEANGQAIYAFMAKRQKKKHPENAAILEAMSVDEGKHYEMWAALTKKKIRSHVFGLKFLTVMMGFTFVLKQMEKGESFGQKEYAALSASFPMAAQMLNDEK